MKNSPSACSRWAVDFFLFQIGFEAVIHCGIADDGNDAGAGVGADGAADLADDDLLAVVGIDQALLDLFGNLRAVAVDDGQDLTVEVRSALTAIRNTLRKGSSENRIPNSVNCSKKIADSSMMCRFRCPRQGSLCLLSASAMNLSSSHLQP